MSIETPTNDVADQLRPAHPDIDDLLGDDLPGDTDTDVLMSSTTEAEPADVADQHRLVPLPDDQCWP
jgi:hypothetical protein